MCRDKTNIKSSFTVIVQIVKLVSALHDSSCVSVAVRPRGAELFKYILVCLNLCMTLIQLFLPFYFVVHI